MRGCSCGNVNYLSTYCFEEKKLIEHKIFSDPGLAEEGRVDDFDSLHVNFGRFWIEKAALVVFTGTRNTL